MTANRHTCHALECGITVPPRMFMCLSHWRRLPRKHQRAIWAAYREGQEIRKDPSSDYLLAQAQAVLAMALLDRIDDGLVDEQRARVGRCQELVDAVQTNAALRLPRELA